MKQLLLLVVVFAIGSQRSLSNAMSATGIVTMKVIRPLFVEAKLPLTFATSTPGSEVDRIEPADANSGQFVVQGEPHMAYQIRLPEQIFMTTDEGNQETQLIEVNDFISFPSGHGKLSEQGEQTLYVGATRGPLRPDQEIGTYRGSYTIDIIY